MEAKTINLSELDLKNDKEIVAISQQAPSFIQKVDAIRIDTELQSKSANDLLTWLKQAYKTLESKRVAKTKPLNDYVKTLNSEFAEKMNPIERAIEILNGKMRDFLLMMRKKAQEEADRKAKIEQERLDKEAKDKASAEADLLEEAAPAVVPTVVVKAKPVANATVTSSLGKTFLKETFAWKVIDASKIPDEYWLLDEKKINALVKAHTKTEKGKKMNDLKIEGVEIFLEADVASR